MTTSVTSATQTSASQTAAAQKTAISSDFDTFLKLLTTQMTNQDPMNPVDSTDFATQLATFSGVEQQTKTNDLLTTLNGQMGLMGMAQLAAWVGQEARSSAPVWAAGDPVSLEITATTGADRAVLVVTDAAGQTVAREELPETGGAMEWTPVDASGAALPEGLYSLTVESYRGETLLGTAPVQAWSPIVEARKGASGATLVLPGGVEIGSDDITALRLPGA
jgi:flagellar basal-body rod modification protein FlgD